MPPNFANVLVSPKFHFNDNSVFFKFFIHSKTKYDQTLLHMVTIQVKIKIKTIKKSAKNPVLYISGI